MVWLRTPPAQAHAGGGTDAAIPESTARAAATPDRLMASSSDAPRLAEDQVRDGQEFLGPAFRSRASVRVQVAVPALPRRAKVRRPLQSVG